MSLRYALKSKNAIMEKLWRLISKPEHLKSMPVKLPLVIALRLVIQRLKFGWFALVLDMYVDLVNAQREQYDYGNR